MPPKLTNQLYLEYNRGLYSIKAYDGRQFHHPDRTRTAPGPAAPAPPGQMLQDSGLPQCRTGRLSAIGRSGYCQNVQSPAYIPMLKSRGLRRDLLNYSRVGIYRVGTRGWYLLWKAIPTRRVSPWYGHNKIKLVAIRRKDRGTGTAILDVFYSGCNI